MNSRAESVPLYGLLGEFDSADALLQAVRRAREAGFHRLEAYSPFSIDGLDEALGGSREYVPLITLGGGVVGALIGYFLQWYSATINYPINVGGRPLDSWPSFLPVTFEIAVLGAAFAALLGMLVLNGLPRLMHPLFELEEFRRASSDRFFLCICSADLLFDRETTRAFLRSLDALAVLEVPE
ncbi:MAG TPA: DUF3341 domain-containing protein [Steroidobacteraceae bacterium]|nr:DUF3341 domain-containing protein [Steroidobacteraceae bacterium]